MIVSSPNTQQPHTAPLCVCLQYVGDNGACPIHGAAPQTHLNKKMVLFPSDGDTFSVLYELAKRDGDRRFGSECRHEQVRNGKCLNCLRAVR
jgi:hypothetical protein